jgi:hypothetical protein
VSGPFTRVFDRAARALHRLVHPQYADEQARLEQLARSISAGASAQAERLSALEKQMKGVAARTETLVSDRTVPELQKQVADLRDAAGRQHRMLAEGLRFAAWGEELRVEERRLERRLRRLAKSTRPVLVGPWSGEVGFELLYWIPFVTWALRKARIAPERIVIVSRGGPESWYAHLGGRYVDALTFVSPDEFRTRTQDAKKQHRPRAFDRALTRLVAARAGLSRPFLLHPGLMYRLFQPFWKQTATVRRVEDHADFVRYAAPRVSTLAGRLPERYVAVRFYFSTCFPDTVQNRAFVESTLLALSSVTDVVLLNTPFELDDHRDAAAALGKRIHSVADLMTPERNLDVQTAVIAGARAFVGTYGGYSYLAPLCGVPSLAFYSVRDAFFAHHLELAERVFRGLQAGSLVALDVQDAALVRTVLGGVELPTA